MPARLDRERLDRTLAQIDDLIRQGKTESAQRSLKRVCAYRLPRERIREVATFARRASQPALGIRLLSPIVYPRGGKKTSASAAERAEHAASLTFLGAPDEALSIVRDIKADETPEVLLYSAFAHFARWDYKAAIPLLTRYVKHPKITGYTRLVGKTNLAAALVFEAEYLKADFLLRELVFDSHVRKTPLLLARALEIAAASHVYQGKLREAQKFIAQGEKLLAENRGIDDLLLRKWRAILHLVREKASPASVRALEKFRDEATAPEAKRDCDRFLALQTKDRARFLHVYFGSPFPRYRARLLSDWGEAIAIPDQYLRDLGGGPTVEIRELRAAALVKQLLRTLSSDFYQSFRVAALHHVLYRDERFNPDSSPRRVHALVSRARELLQKQKPTLTIDEHKGSYRLVAKAPCQLAVRLDTQDDPFAVFATPFSASDFAKGRAISDRTARRMLADAVKHGRLVTEGRGRALRYRSISGTTPQPCQAVPSRK